MPDYLDRFDGSQKFLNLSSLISRQEIEQAIEDVQIKNQFKNSTFKLVLIGDGEETDEQLNPNFSFSINSYQMI